MGAPDHLLTQSVCVQSPTGERGKGGDPLFNTLCVLSARVEFVDDIVLDDSGNQRAARAKVWTTEPIPFGSRVWLPGADAAELNESLRPLRISSMSPPDQRFTLQETTV